MLQIQQSKAAGLTQVRHHHVGRQLLLAPRRTGAAACSHHLPYIRGGATNTLRGCEEILAAIGLCIAQCRHVHGKNRKLIQPALTLHPALPLPLTADTTLPTAPPLPSAATLPAPGVALPCTSAAPLCVRADSAAAAGSVPAAAVPYSTRGVMQMRMG